MNVSELGMAPQQVSTAPLPRLVDPMKFTRSFVRSFTHSLKLRGPDLPAQPLHSSVCRERDCREPPASEVCARERRE